MPTVYCLNFDGLNGSERFEICYQSLVMNERQIPVDDWEDVVTILKGLQKLGTPAQNVNGVQLYDLNRDGEFSALSLERSQWKLLINFIERPIWRAHILDRVTETLKWLKSIPVNE